MVSNFKFNDGEIGGAKMNNKYLLSMLTCLSMIVLPLTSHAALTPKEELGKFIFFDTNLSTPIGQSCGSCHSPTTGFVDPDQFLPTSEGVVAGRFGRRNAQTITYVSLSPEFRNLNGVASGGQLWDGRALNLVEQAKLPFLNPDEMNNPDIKTVVTKVCSSIYAALFKQVYGVKSCKSNAIPKAFDFIADAIAAFERSSELNKFTSKFDIIQGDIGQLTPLEFEGRLNFRGFCSQCHTLPSGFEIAGPFTDFNYRNIGLPKNTEFPFSTMDQTVVDIGLGKTTGNPLHNGQFKTPSLRNVANTAPYMHNGVLKTLKDVVHFYNTRDVPGVWPAPEVTANMDTTIGNMGMTSAAEDSIVAFLMTLTDGFVP